jgi:transposase
MAPGKTHSELDLLRQENAALRTQIAWLKKQMFGAGKSETFERAQLLLKLGELEKLAAAAAPKTMAITYERPAGKPAPRTPPAEAFAQLPVQETLEVVPDEVMADPELYERIGEERTFEIDVTPPRLFKCEIVRPKYRHRLDRSRAPVCAMAPARAASGGYASAGLIAWIALSK